MQALVYTGTQELVYREEKNPKVINGESIVKVKDFEKTLNILANKKIGSLNWIEYRKLKDGFGAFKEIHNGTCIAPKIILLVN